jgi:hypothetical protein
MATRTGRARNSAQIVDVVPGARRATRLTAPILAPIRDIVDTADDFIARPRRSRTVSSTTGTSTVAGKRAVLAALDEHDKHRNNDSRHVTTRVVLRTTSTRSARFPGALSLLLSLAPSPQPLSMTPERADIAARPSARNIARSGIVARVEPPSRDGYVSEGDLDVLFGLDERLRATARPVPALAGPDDYESAGYDAMERIRSRADWRADVCQVRADHTHTRGVLDAADYSQSPDPAGAESQYRALSARYDELERRELVLLDQADQEDWADMGLLGIGHGVKREPVSTALA